MMLNSTGRATASPLQIDTQTINEGRCQQFTWKTGVRHIRLPIMVCRRTAEQIKALAKTTARHDPKLLSTVQKLANSWANSSIPSQILAQQSQLDLTASRSLRKDFFIAMQLEPFIGCLLDTKNYNQATALTNPCHGNQFDSNGRPIINSYQNNPIPPLFISIPPHHWQGDSVIIGELPAGQQWPSYDLRPLDDAFLNTPAQRLVTAAGWGDIEQLDKLIHDRRSPIDINTELAHVKGHSALLEAVNKGQADAVRWLLEQGANPDIETRFGSTPIKIAEIIGNQEIIHLLKQHSAQAGDTAK